MLHLQRTGRWIAPDRCQPALIGSIVGRRIMTTEPDPLPTDTDADTPDLMARPEQPPMDDDAAGTEGEAAKLGDFA